MKTKKKYLMLVFEENSDKSLEFYSDNPYRGRLSDIVYGDNVKELMISSDGHSNEGLFYVLYSAVDGTMISYGIIDFAAITDEISSKENLSKAKISLLLWLLGPVDYGRKWKISITMEWNHPDA